jgi:acetyltransferase-like isoleucine patch superfamily enzyme
MIRSVGAPGVTEMKAGSGPETGDGTPLQQERVAPGGLRRTLGFAARHGLLTPKYALLALRFAVRRLLTPAGHRISTDGMLFLGPRLQIQIGRGARVRFGRFVWVGAGTKIRCHEGVVEIGAKTVVGQDCTFSAYQRIRIGEQCVIADRVMFIDFDHVVTDTERPIRVQGIYKRDVVVGSNVWIGYGAQILRGVSVGDNSIIGASAVVTRDIPANSVVAGSPARVVRTREAPRDLKWRDPVEPPSYGPSGPR